jgi:hypothetical protein
MMSVCFLSELLTQRFGVGWYCGGKMNVSLVNIVWGSDTSSARSRAGVARGLQQRAHGRLCEKPDGVKVIRKALARWWVTPPRHHPHNLQPGTGLTVG